MSESEKSFDSLDSNSGFTKCMNNLELNIINNLKHFSIEPKTPEIKNTLHLKGGNHDTKDEYTDKDNDNKHKKIRDIIDTDKLPKKREKIIDDFKSNIENLKDVKVGEIKHNNQIIDVFMDRNKKKYVNYKGKRVYT